MQNNTFDSAANTSSTGNTVKPLDNASLLLDRSFAPDSGDLLAGFKRILVVNPSDDGYCQQLANQYPQQQFSAYGFNLVAHQALLTQLPQQPTPANLTSCCAAELSPATVGSPLTSDSFDCVIIYFPKSKPEFNYLLNNIFNYVSLGATIFVVGENTGGVKSCEKPLAVFCRKARKLDSARHCALYQTTLERQSAPFVKDEWFKHYQVTIKQITIDVYGLPGVFSFGALDPGTQLLLEKVDHQVDGRLLDFGCGAGIIGCYLAKTNPRLVVTGIDVNALAIASTEKTFAANHINGQALLANGLAGLAKTAEKFDHVYSNPPFHSGIKTHYAVTELFLGQVSDYIYSTGSLTIVANNFLNYQDLITKPMGEVKTIAADRRFNVYQTVKTNH